MKWILPLIALAILTPSCTTKPYMVGSVNEQFYKRHATPGWRLFRRQKKLEIHTTTTEAPVAAPYTSSK